LVKSSNTPPPSEATKTPNKRITEFLIQEFPEQKEAHRHAAEQLPPQKPKNYTFANQTQSDF
jgi:hypothetical protein